MPATVLLGVVGENGFSHFIASGLTLKKAYANLYIAVLHLSDLEPRENILWT